MNNRFGKMIKAARGAETLRDFSKKIGISHTHLDSIERGYDQRTGKPVNLTVITLIKIAKSTGIDAAEMIDIIAKESEGR